MKKKTTRAFRTISEAADELGLQSHVLRFWESKFPQVKPIKRGGGRRFYRPEDIEFLRGIKILLHDEKHPIKDVQKLIQVKGTGRVLELGRSTQKAARDKRVKETVLIPERIQAGSEKVGEVKKNTKLENITVPVTSNSITPESITSEPEPVEQAAESTAKKLNIRPDFDLAPNIDQNLRPDFDEAGAGLTQVEIVELEEELSRLLDLKERWLTLKASL